MFPQEDINIRLEEVLDLLPLLPSFVEKLMDVLMWANLNLCSL